MQPTIQIPQTQNLQSKSNISYSRQIVYDVFYSTPSVKWTNKPALESGFYKKIRKNEYFFGINYELWKSNGISICLSFKLSGEEGLHKFLLLDRFIKHNHQNELHLSNFNGNAVVEFRNDYFEREKDVLKIKELVGSLCAVVE